MMHRIDDMDSELHSAHAKLDRLQDVDSKLDRLLRLLDPKNKTAAKDHGKKHLARSEQGNEEEQSESLLPPPAVPQDTKVVV
jgi:hypothetical protein